MHRDRGFFLDSERNSCRQNRLLVVFGIFRLGCDQLGCNQKAASRHDHAKVALVIANAIQIGRENVVKALRRIEERSEMDWVFLVPEHRWNVSLLAPFQHAQ